MKPVIFTTQRSTLARAENLKAVYDAYDGEKKFIQMDIWRTLPQMFEEYSVIVSDEIPHQASAPVICISHGIAGGKHYGFDQKYKYVKPGDGELITYAISSSEKTVGIVASSHDIKPEQVKVIGMPRTDIVLKADREQTDWRTYLYLPTYRTREEANDRTMDLEYHEVMIVKSHMMAGQMLPKPYPNIIEVHPQLPTTPLIINADVIISDYSTVIFDGYVRRIPAVLFAKDTEQYMRERGMYFDYPMQYSSRFCDNEPELLELLRSATWTDSDEELRDFFASACDGHSTERVIELIKSVGGGADE